MEEDEFVGHFVFEGYSLIFLEKDKLVGAPQYALKAAFFLKIVMREVRFVAEFQVFFPPYQLKALNDKF